MSLGLRTCTITLPALISTDRVKDTALILLPDSRTADATVLMKDGFRKAFVSMATGVR